MTARRQEAARRAGTRSTRSSSSRQSAEVREADAAPTRWRCRSIRARSGGRCSPTPIASSATSSTTRTCTASTGRPRAIATPTLLDDCGHALGRELRARRVHRRAERVAHLPRRRRRGRGARARRRHARRRLGARERRLPHQAHRRAAAPWDADARVAARRARRERQGRRLRPRGERRAARRPSRIRGRRSAVLGGQHRRADGEQDAGPGRRAAGRR